MINVKLNIIEPWEYGTETAVHATIVKSDNEVFLLSLKVPIIIKGENAKYFVCKPIGIETNKLLSSQTEGTFPISMVFDKSLKDATTELPLFENYRSNFLSGEVIKNGS